MFKKGLKCLRKRIKQLRKLHYASSCLLIYIHLKLKNNFGFLNCILKDENNI